MTDPPHDSDTESSGHLRIKRIRRIKDPDWGLNTLNSLNSHSRDDQRGKMAGSPLPIPAEFFGGFRLEAGVVRITFSPMSKTETLAELPRLSEQEGAEILDHLWHLA